MRNGTINENFSEITAAKVNTTPEITEKGSSLSASSLLAKAGVPISHVIAADNYMFIKKIYGTPVVKSRITNKDKALLGKYDFNQLEYTTIKQINEELELLKRWSSSYDDLLKKDADDIIDIRLNIMHTLN